MYKQDGVEISTRITIDLSTVEHEPAFDTLVREVRRYNEHYALHRNSPAPGMIVIRAAMESVGDYAEFLDVIEAAWHRAVVHTLACKVLSDIDAVAIAYDGGSYAFRMANAEDQVRAFIVDMHMEDQSGS